MAVSAMATAAPVQLGPLNPGAEHGSDDWYYGTNGAAYLSVDDTDPAKGSRDFVIGNKVAGEQNRADWRSPVFPLGPAAEGARPITFSFACKFPDKINGRENMQVYLRFFDAAGTNCLGQKIYKTGFNTGSSNMSGYQTMTFPDIRAPKRAQTADVWVTANIVVPWTSGTGQFDDFSVTTDARLGLAWRLFFTGLVIGLVFMVVAAVKAWSKNQNDVSSLPGRLK